MSLKILLQLISQTVKNFGRHDVPSYAAAIAYHAIISLAPLLLVSIAVASRVFGAEAAAGEVVTAIDQYVGPTVAAVIEDIIAYNHEQPRDTLVAAVIALCLTIYAASNVFRQLVVALDVVWNVEPPTISIRQGVTRWLMSRLRKYIVGLLMALGIVLSLLAWLIVNVVLGFFINLLQLWIPGLVNLLAFFNFLVLPLLLALFCSLIFKVLPDADIAWRDVWPGAIVTGIALALGEGLIGLYASRNRISTFYGVAGSVVILMLWTYLSAYILLAGAEFSQVYATWLKQTKE